MKKKHPWFKSRHYLHFDSPVGFKLAQKTVSSPKRVSKHSFYPLISYEITSMKLKREIETGKLKKKHKPRPISYSSHLDSHIYSYYAWRLSALYENALKAKKIDRSVLAFRALGKSNIDFAASAFDEIRNRDSCSVVALDITGFFKNLDHEVLKKNWSSLLGTDKLPADHFSVFKSLTKYSSVDKTKLYELFNISPNNPKKGRYRICTSEEFRNCVRGNCLITTNDLCKGVPQGSPISALLSNIYMIEFDVAMNRAVSKMGGTYYRYCDDMLFIVPIHEKENIERLAIKEIDSHLLDINSDKTERRDFQRNNGVLRSNKPLQYLGFTFDGKNILIRSSALARFSEKMKRGVKFAKATMKKRNISRANRGEVEKELYRREIYNRYSHLGARNFITYGHRASKVMNSRAIARQLKPLWGRLKVKLDDKT